jgi:ribosomal protein S18 acetylase RimI-like enzyme
MVAVREARPEDAEAIWQILRPVIAAGETYALPRDLSRDAALAYWFAEANEVFVAEDESDVEGEVLGTYILRPNQQGGGSHVANCGYMTAPKSFGKGIARAMCADSLDRAHARGFRAMQFNFVVSSNERAVRLWRSFGFAIVARLPEAFLHPALGYVDAFVMHRIL